MQTRREWESLCIHHPLWKTEPLDASTVAALFTLLCALLPDSAVCSFFPRSVAAGNELRLTEIKPQKLYEGFQAFFVNLQAGVSV